MVEPGWVKVGKFHRYLLSQIANVAQAIGMVDNGNGTTGSVKQPRTTSAWRGSNGISSNHGNEIILKPPYCNNGNRTNDVRSKTNNDSARLEGPPPYTMEMASLHSVADKQTARGMELPEREAPVQQACPF